MVTISILEQTLSDGSLVYDVQIVGPESTMTLHAVTCDDATALADKVAAAVRDHTVHDAKVKFGGVTSWGAQ